MNFSLYLAFVCLAALVAVEVNANTVPAVSEARIQVVKDIRNFAKNHPGLKFQRMSKEQGKARNLSVRYTLGARLSGDRLVAQGSDVFAYPAKKDVTIQLTYPEAGSGSIVTYVDLICTQDNNDGNAYVVAGGIGQRFISIVVEANQTENFSYRAEYYGSD